jgi:hypothetical protein
MITQGLGSYVVDFFDNTGNVVKRENAINYTDGVAKCKKWDGTQDGNTSILTRILFNTLDTTNYF